ncbi:MAG: hypothetical protein L0I95_12885 [Tetragenococcus koreensis]|nr:hypothetical protein [Tetragenococcus koreensis]MDN6612140.1 hypothetical protein [Staphylococcus equorum]
MILNKIKVVELNIDDWLAISVKNKGVLRTLLGKVVYCTSPFDSDEIKATVELTDGMTISIDDNTNFKKLNKPFSNKVNNFNNNDVGESVIQVNHRKYLKSIKKELFGYSVQLTEKIEDCAIFDINDDIDTAIKATGGKKIKLINIAE